MGALPLPLPLLSLYVSVPGLDWRGGGRGMVMHDERAAVSGSNRPLQIRRNLHDASVVVTCPLMRCFNDRGVTELGTTSSSIRSGILVVKRITMSIAGLDDDDDEAIGMERICQGRVERLICPATQSYTLSNTTIP